MTIPIIATIAYDPAAHAHRVRLSRAARLRLARALMQHQDTFRLGLALERDANTTFVCSRVQAGVIRAAAGLCGIRVGGQG